jgi:hypothetical protein
MQVDPLVAYPVVPSYGCTASLRAVVGKALAPLTFFKCTLRKKKGGHLGALASPSMPPDLSNPFHENSLFKERTAAKWLARNFITEGQARQGKCGDDVLAI